MVADLAFDPCHPTALPSTKHKVERHAEHRGEDDEQKPSEEIARIALLGEDPPDDQEREHEAEHRRQIRQDKDEAAPQEIDQRVDYVLYQKIDQGRPV